MRMLAGAVAATMLCGVAQAQTMTTGWGEIRFDAATCIAGARSAIEGVGYTNVTTGRESAFGWRGTYGIAVRCIAERNIVIYFLYGPDQAANEQLGNQLRPLLLRGPGQAAPGK